MVKRWLVRSMVMCEHLEECLGSSLVIDGNGDVSFMASDVISQGFN